MAKRRTRSSKVAAAKKRTKGSMPEKPGGYQISFGAIEHPKISVQRSNSNKSEANYFRSDLTKVILLTMLALALEIALWLYLPR